jgi:hypothetical protein
MTAASPDRGAFFRERPLLAPSRAPLALLCSGWPAGATAALLHRCAGQRLDLFSTAFAGRARPHALSRSLQVDASTSTTVDRSSIPCRGIRGRDDCHAPAGSRLPDRGSRRRGSRSGVEEPISRHSRSRLLVTGTSPQPRSLRAPFVARRRPPPVWSDAAGEGRCQRRARLQGGLAGRAVERRRSAKMPAAHRPEVPSVTRTFANERCVSVSRG